MTKIRWGAYLASALVPALLAMPGPVAAADVNFAATTAISLPGGLKIRSFDISFVDPAIGLYFLADRTNKSIDVIDTATNEVKALLTASPPFAGSTSSNDTSGPDGVFIVSNRFVWAGDGNSTVKVIDLFSQQTTHVISTGGKNRADEGCWDSRDNVTLWANDAEDPFPFVSFISTTSFTVLGKITMDGTINGGSVLATPKATNGIEQCQWDRETGHFFINIPEVDGDGTNSQPGATVEINPVSHAIVNIFSIPLSSCSGPQGMAIGPSPQILLGCNGGSKQPSTNPTAILNKKTGCCFATVNQQSGADEVDFNSTTGVYFLARSAAVGGSQLLGTIDSGNPGNNASTFTATSGLGNAHSVGADRTHNQAYVPIPATASTICGSLGGNNALGCIAVFTPK